ncbi:polysaccharide biosynthesis tyrosine autokinase [Thalassotalea ponticola]|uniref:polysaccharide biosynthesis tyrosine autokinase n=1 Tax=Thalassotalea ponticola TaxID=1523392 RepID=UPI0025B569E0|nr:polysaccharide biosynthesis tyrosine autokinase [Thalassotalea ponticola]MDN3652644.1 polysaccharide biosynthesis tyrosine autokinase [Thalassotalea ponticola]
MSQEQLNTKLNQHNSHHINEQSDDIDFSRYFNLLLENKWLIAGVTTLFAIAGVIIALLQTPIYKADALVQIEQKATGVPGLGDMEELFGAESKAITEIELLKSRKVLGDAVDELKLDIIAKPKHFGKLGEYYARKYAHSYFGGQITNVNANSITTFNKPFISTFFDSSYAWGGEHINVAQFKVAKPFLGKTFELIAKDNDQYQVYLAGELVFSGRVNQVATNQDNSIQLLVNNLKAQSGTAFTLTRTYRADAIAKLQSSLQVAEKGKQSGILTLALQGPNRQQAEDTLNAIADAFLLQNVKRMSQEVEKSIEFLNKELPKIDAAQVQAENTLNKFRLDNDAIDLTLETESVLEQLVELDTKIHELSFLEVDIAQKYTQEHPKYQSLLAKKRDLEAQKQQLNAQIKDLPQAQQQILRMARDVEVNQQIYLALLNKVQELNVVKASTVGNINIVDYAQVSRFPIKPKKSLIVVIITLLGGFLAVAYVILKSAFHRGVTNPQDFEDVGLNVYATVPLSEDHIKRTQLARLQDKVKRNKRKAQRHELLAEVNPADMAIEAIRSLRTSLHFAMMEAKNNVVMIAGASPEVGKSFVSSNLAAVIAQAGQKVLVIDADMRKGYMHKIFQLNEQNGLSDILVGKLSIEQATQNAGVDNLHFISRGNVPPNPSEILMGERFSTLIEHAKANYDLVIIDTPPILAVTDAAIVGNHAGTSLMLARYDYSPLKEIIAGANRFDINGVDIKGIIFNAVEKRQSDYGYYHYGYEYK